VREWPPIVEPELLERLAFDRDQFVAFYRTFAAALGHRDFGPALLERALGYPWSRPARSYLLRGADLWLVDDLAPRARRSTVRAFARDRHPLLAFGSNAAPTTLTMKFAHFPAEADRAVLVSAGDLHGLDVGVAASPTGYGSMPAALFTSPGTAVRAAVLWLTPNQVTQLTWSELSYQLARLDRAHFVMDEDDIEVDEVFGFVSRFGAFCVDGDPAALGAIPATGRTAAPLSQEQLLDVAGRLAIGPGARAADLVRAVFEDMAGLLARAEERLWPCARPLPPDQWTPYPAAAPAPGGRRG
jgi:hypothetical protein